jgi:hypothetical protein
MSKVHVNPGVCGLLTTVIVEKAGRSNLKIELDTKCPYIKKMEADIQDLDGYTECFSKFSTSEVYKAADQHCKHLACPVPSAIIKAIEVESGLALPREVHFNIEK